MAKKIASKKPAPAHPTDEPIAPDAADDAAPPFDVAQHIADGYRFESRRGQLGWDVTSPAGRFGSGETPADAVANIDAVIIPDASGCRVLHRTTGETVVLDGVAPADGEG